MLPTYRATLRGAHLEWKDETPEQARDQRGVTVLVTILGESVPSDEQVGKRMAEALGRLAARGGVTAINDASDWQREQREDRPLPGRSR